MKKKFSIFTLILLLVLSHCMPAMASMEYGVIYDETDELGSDTPTQAVETMAESVGMGYIFDVSDMLTYEEWEKLESRARDISKRQHCGVYFALVDDYTDYGEGAYMRSPTSSITAVSLASELIGMASSFCSAWRSETMPCSSTVSTPNMLSMTSVRKSWRNDSMTTLGTMTGTAVFLTIWMPAMYS